ncbi:MAG TPA: 4-hydroxythreonine-4-phosphate dehydrogenase PdxA [Ottowia sp.]|uniref:4-hydroxythreonine-4-phosphate dehydrogenase PdxA n=1 Tax=Ottowia sp. TaxID=1898956 RepID=UPI002C63B234|nr:4-hydroxythreonine-4-phosphate dehydrogenase PdxA [Ottowia sp.]HMN19885.1 4-hydroxythreonine-4-phosphate dehydrogenase PdxA [Ottowia sp.]
MKPIAITLGDPAGIGPEIIAKAFRDAPDVLRGCFAAGDVATLRRAAAVVQGAHGVDLPVAALERAADAALAPPRCIPVLQVVASQPLVRFGRISARAGRIAGDCVSWAARAALRGEISALVTAPLHKEALAAAGAPYDGFPGHTELLQALAAEHLGVAVAELPVRMMLANEELRTVLVSIHVSLREAIALVTIGNIVTTLRIVHESVGRALHRAPRIAVAGLNPHAGEGGLFGREEIDIIAPAIAQARAEGISAQGPFAPDTVFMRARGLREFDVVVAMYHDQGLIPVKYLGVEQGVNVTLGLPLVRTSPDHGTAFDLAGSGRADAASLVAAVRMARQLAT